MAASEARRRIAVLDSREGGYLRDVDIEAEILEPVADVELVHVTHAREAHERLREVDALIVWHTVAFGRADLAHVRGCAGIVCASVGTDHVDVDAARALGIGVRNVPDYGTDEVADHTLALLLAVARNVPHVAETVRQGGWRWQCIGRVQRLKGRRLGIVGLGRIGTGVARRCAAFGMRVAYYDPYVEAAPEPGFELDRVASLHGLLAASDLVTLHVPLTPETRGMIGRRELALLPRGAMLVNTSRGDVLQQEPLLDALREGRLAGAGLDVLAGEPAVPPELTRHERVVLTAHSAFFSEQALVDLRTKAALAAREMLSQRRGR